MPAETDPACYLLTWRTYGTWLPGDERGWVDERRNGRGEPFNAPDVRLENAAKGQMRSRPVLLDDAQRRAVDDAIRESCAFRGWHLWALNVRTNHVHAVVAAAESPEQVQATLKARATRLLRELRLLSSGGLLWSRGGSQRRLVREEAVWAAVDYVRNRQ